MPRGGGLRHALRIVVPGQHLRPAFHQRARRRKAGTAEAEECNILSRKARDWYHGILSQNSSNES